MPIAGRNAIVVTLSAAAAALDAWSFFGLGHVFVANMTGNTVLMGYTIFSGSHGRAIRTAVSLACYALGALIGALLARPIRLQLQGCIVEQTQQLPWPHRATVILALEWLLVSCCAVVAWLVHPATASITAAVLIGVVAFAVGLQSSAVNSLRLPGIATTYITGTWTVLFAGLAQLGDGEIQGVERPRRKVQLSLEAKVLLAYFLSATVCGLIAHWLGHRSMGFYPAALLLLVLVWIAAGRVHDDSTAVP